MCSKRGRESVYEERGEEREGKRSEYERGRGRGRGRRREEGNEGKDEREREFLVYVTLHPGPHNQLLKKQQKNCV